MGFFGKLLGKEKPVSTTVPPAAGNGALVRDWIVKEMGLSGCSEKQQNELVEKILETIFQGVIVRCLQTMSERQKSKLEAFLKERGDTSENLILFLQSKFPGFGSIVKKEVERYKEQTKSIEELLK